MARITVASQATIIAALEARLVVANQVCGAQREKIAILEAKLNAKSGGPTKAPVVTQYRDRAGNCWEKTTLGNVSRSHMVSHA